MSANQPLRKPRYPDGRPMSEDEIRGLDGRTLDETVAVCVCGHNGQFSDTSSSFGGYCKPYSTDIAAAFGVDRPEWRWEMEDYDRDHFDVTVWGTPKVPITGCYEQRLDHKPTPQDYARARCIAALLLAAKIGE